MADGFRTALLAAAAFLLRRSPPPCRDSTRATGGGHPSAGIARRARPAVRVGVFLAPVRETPAHIALAEELGFASAWCYDSPLLYQDPFVALARAAERTRRIDLGVGVLVPGCARPSRRWRPSAD